MTVPSLRSHTDAFIAALEAIGLEVGDATAPVPRPEKYVVVHTIPGGRISGTLENPHEDAEIVYQATCVGSTRRQAQWVTDKAMQILNGFLVDGRAITFVDIDGVPDVRQDTTLTPPLYYSTPRFRVRSSPA